MALTERAPATRTPAAAMDRVVDEAEATRVLRRSAWFVGLVWLPVIVLWRGLPFALTADHAFVYAEVARHLAHGDGSTFDTLSATNGFHPLWLALALPLFLVGLDGVAALRALLVVQLGLWVTTLWVIAGIAGRRLGATPRIVPLVAASVLAMAGLNPFVLRLVVNGAESAPVALLLVLLLDRVDRQGGEVLGGTQLTRLVTGALLGLAFLARTDTAMLLVCVAAWCLIEARAEGRAARQPLAEVLVLPSLTVLAYGAINLAWFGHLTQVSSTVTRADVTPVRALLFLLAGAVAVAVMAGLSRGRDPERPARFARVGDFTAHTSWYAAFLVLVAGYQATLSTQLRPWSLAPLVVYLLALATLAAADLGDGARLADPSISPRQAVVPLAAVLGLPLMVALVVQVRAFTDPGLRADQEADRALGGWMSAHLDKDAVIGAWDPGPVAYFTDQPVIDLGGAAGSFDYVEATEDGTQGEYLLDRDLAYVVDHRAVVEGEDPEIRARVGALLGADAAAQLTREHRIEVAGDGAPSAVSLYRFLG